MAEIPNAALKLSDIPAPDAREDEIFQFAATFNGYEANPGESKCADLANRAARTYEETNAVPDSLHELRTCLFFEYRRNHHTGGSLSPKEREYLRALVIAVRARLGQHAGSAIGRSE